MFTTVGLLSLLALAGRETTPPRASFHYRPRVEVWTNRGDDAYSSGQAVRVYFRTEQDAYVTILRVDTDGRVRVLFPREPWDDSFARGGRDYDVPGGSVRDAFFIDDYPGVGYIFAVAAADPFIYDAIESGDHWDYRVIADGRVRGDPYVALTDLAQRIVPDGYTDWDYDIAPYYVQQRYDYPRFLCYDCHTYVSYPYWSPYDHACDRFRIVVFDDPYYYPYRHFGGTRAVFPRPLRPEPRFIFKDRTGLETFISRVKQRPANDDRRREVGVRGRDLGTGLIPPPTIKPRTSDDRPDERQADRPPQFRPERVRPDPAAPPPPSPEPERPRAEPRREPEARSRVEPPARPQSEPRAEPRREPEARPRVEPPARPQSEPRAEPRQEAPREKPTAEPELKRRKP